MPRTRIVRILVRWRAGPTWTSGPPEDQPGWDEHAVFVDDLIERGIFVMGGPYADYSGRSDVAHLVGLIRKVLVDLRPVRRFREPSSAITLFEARVEGDEVQGTLFEQYDGKGALVDAMLTVRPYAGLRAAMRAMQALMERSPLPGAES